jgi:23S rRNA pseudouridine1911/1915/1917 synthase
MTDSDISTFNFTADTGSSSDVNGERSEIVYSSISDEGMRADMFLARQLGLTRSFIQKLIKQGNITIINERKLKPSTRLGSKECFHILVPPAENLEVSPEDVPFTVIHEDEDILVIDKPAGIVVHPAPGNWHGTLVHGLLYRYPEIGMFNNVIRPGIVHRLDQTTSGLMVIARNQLAMESLQEQFRTRTVKKTYLALSCGIPENDQALIDLPIGRNPRNRKKMAIVPSGRSSQTLYRAIWSHSGKTLMECELLTGRTHQIRVHLQSIGCPLAGDMLYGGKNIPLVEMGRVFLHSWKLKFIHPRSRKDLKFLSVLPDTLIQCLKDILSSQEG